MIRPPFPTGKLKAKMKQNHLNELAKPAQHESLLIVSMSDCSCLWFNGLHGDTIRVKTFDCQGVFSYDNKPFTPLISSTETESRQLVKLNHPACGRTYKDDISGWGLT